MRLILAVIGVLAAPMVAHAQISGAMIARATIAGMGGTQGRPDAGVEAQGPNALISTFDTTSPGNDATESAYTFMAYDLAGNVRKRASISAKWCPGAINGGVLRLNPTADMGLTDGPFFRLWANGASFFGTSNCAHPGFKVLEVNGQIAVTGDVARPGDPAGVFARIAALEAQVAALMAAIEGQR